MQAGSSKLVVVFGHKGSIKHYLNLFGYKGDHIIKPAYCTSIMVRLEIDTELAVGCGDEEVDSCVSVKDIVFIRK